MVYSGIVGSKSYGIEIETSDTDISIIQNTHVDYCKKYLNGIDTSTSSITRFEQSMFGDSPLWYFTQWLFPKKFLVKNDLANYIVESRDEIILAKHPTIYDTFLKRADGLRYHANFMYKRHPKRMVYSTLFYSILANYAEGMSFAQAHRPEGELHDFLIGMRLGQVPLADAVARNELERLRAEKAAGFYKEAVHPEILREFEHVLLDQAEKERIATWNT